MSWWDNVTAQFVGDLMAGTIVMAFALIGEALLDEWRERRHGRKSG